MSQVTPSLRNFSYKAEKIADKTILVTGGTTGIGRTTALLLASEGAQVIIFGRHEKELNDALNDFREENLTDRVHGLVADVAEETGIKEVFREVDKRFGGLDILINNAGLPYGGVQEGAYEDWQYLLNTNLLGYIACAREAVDRMKKKGKGHILNVGSVSADRRQEDSAIYVASRSAVQGFSEALGKELNPLNIKVSLVEPGSVGTDLKEESVPEQREMQKKLEMLKAEDIAVSIFFALTQPWRCEVAVMKVKPHLDKW